MQASEVTDKMGELSLAQEKKFVAVEVPPEEEEEDVLVLEEEEEGVVEVQQAAEPALFIRHESKEEEEEKAVEVEDDRKKEWFHMDTMDVELPLDQLIDNPAHEFPFQLDPF